MSTAGCSWTRSHRGLPRATVLCAVMLAVITPVSFLGVEPARASTADGDGPAETSPIRQRDMFRSAAGQQMWISPSQRRGFFGFGTHDYYSENLPPLTGVIAVDLDHDKEVGRLDLPPVMPLIRSPLPGGTAFMKTGWHNMALDHDQGRLFATYTSPRTADSGQATPGTCARILRSEPGTCLEGVHIIDAETMTLLGSIPVNELAPDGPSAIPVARGMQYAPPRWPGDAGKVLVVVETLTQQGFSSTTTDARQRGVNAVHVVQLDPVSMRQDWAYRIDGCRGAREYPEDGVHAGASDLQNPAAVFRTADAADSRVVVACHNTRQTVVVTEVPVDREGMVATAPIQAGDPSAIIDKVSGPDPRSLQRDDAVRTNRAPIVTTGPSYAVEVIADAAGERLLTRVMDSGKAAAEPTAAEVWWVYDAQLHAFVGTIGIGKMDVSGAQAGLDPQTGRLYVLRPGVDGGLFVADTRRTPLAQPLVFPEWREAATRRGAWLSIDSGAPGRPPRIFAQGRAQTHVVLEDTIPASAMPAPVEEAGRTLDIDERAGVTSSSVDGAARGFGARAILIGGAEAAARVGTADPVGVARLGIGAVHGSTMGLATGYSAFLGVVAQSLTGHDSGLRKQDQPMDWLLPWPDSCSDTDRELVLGFVGSDGAAVVDGSGARGTARPFVLDPQTRGDGKAPVSRCIGKDWQGLWSGAAVGRSPLAEPGAPEAQGDAMASCTSGDAPEGAVGDSVMGAFAAAVSCQEDAASGFSYARGATVQGTQVAEALSSFRIYRDPGRGIVSRVESVARGISIDALIRIDAVRGTAESWANGRRQPVPVSDREAGYDANCDSERTAGTCFRRHLFGVRTPGYSCGPCGDETQAVTAIHRALGANGSARLREPDERLSRGSEDGLIAAIQKPDTERIADMVLNNDLLQTVVPTLEVVRYAAPNRPLFAGGRKGRQVYQFAGVEVSSSYAISCLLVYDEATNTCAAPKEDPATIKLALTDREGAPLAGGAFELRTDTDADGHIGVADTLLPGGACLTTDDGTGNCTFDGLAAGGYLVSQVTAPPGHARVTTAHHVELAAGEMRTVTFVNEPDGALIAVTATDETGQPLPGAVFAAYPDPDGDGDVAAGVAPAATCTSDRAGTCTMTVPVGSYVLVQTGAPGGLAPIEPIPFALAASGQTAAVQVVNYLPSAAPLPAAAPAPVEVRYSAPTPVDPPVSEVSQATPPATTPDDSLRPQMAQALGGTIVRVVRAPGDTMRLLARHPKQGVAWIAALLLLWCPLLTVRRRLLLATVDAAPVALFATRGGKPRDPVPARPEDGVRRAQPAPPAASSGPSLASLAVAQTAAAVATRGSAVGLATDRTTRAVLATSSRRLMQCVKEALATDPACTLLRAVTSLEELRRTLEHTRPDVLIIDLALRTAEERDMCDLLPELHDPAATVGVVSRGRALDAATVRAYRAGVGGLLAFDDLGQGQLSFAAACVASGKPFYGPTVQAVMRHYHPEAEQPDQNLLTARELQVALLAAEGVRRSEIAAQLYLSPMTVKRHLQVIRRKLGVTNPREHTQLRRRLEEAGIDVPPAGHPR